MKKQFNPASIPLTQYLLFTGKGGVGKTSAACATALTLADSGKKVLLVSTDPASNLQDVFSMELTGSGVAIPDAPNLVVANLDPIQAAAEYRESVIAPYRGKLPDSVLANMEEQLSGSCTVEIAAFNEFSNFITDPAMKERYHHIIFDTAPTGHTLRMLQLPSAWSNFISESTHGASCLGQLSGLEQRKDVYKNAVAALTDAKQTTLVLVSRPEYVPLQEAARASNELRALGVNNQILVINGVLAEFDDAISESLYKKQQNALTGMPDTLKILPEFDIPLRAYNIMGLNNIRSLLTSDEYKLNPAQLMDTAIPTLGTVIEDLHQSGKKVIFTMGKGGVGKTTIAAAIALGLAGKGAKVHLTTTDPAAHLNYVIAEHPNISVSHIDEHAELAKYKEEVLQKARETMSVDDLAYVEEDLRSPCTQEIAVFRAFAQIVERAENEVGVIDTAPTGHTLLLLDSTQSYHREIQRSQGDIPESVKKLLPRLRNAAETEVIIVALAETTPVYEAMRLESDLARAGIHSKWWVINSSLFAAAPSNRLLRAKASNEIEWINKVNAHSNGHYTVIPWHPEEMNEQALQTIIQ